MTTFKWPDVQVGDVYFVIGNDTPSQDDWKKVKRSRWYKALPKNFPGMPPDFNLWHAYNKHCYQEGTEPPWTRHLSRVVRRELRRMWLTGEYFDPLAILLRYRQKLGFICAIEDSGLIYEACRALNIFRLQYIRQLGFLHDPVINEAVSYGIGTRFNHTRYLHSLMVMATASLMGRQVKLSEYDLRHLQVAALTHDALTPAGGDSIKPIDFAAFDEDVHYPEVFRNNPEWDRVCERFGLSEELLAATVRGEGILGHLLDLADKSTYTAHDVEAYLMGDHDPRTFRHFEAPESILSVWDLKESLGNSPCRLWDKIAVLDGEVVVTSPEKLAGFLKLRAHMFRHLYYNPLARYREHMLAVLILEPLYHEGVLTRAKLLRMNDDDLDNYLNQVTGHDNLRLEISRTEVAPCVETFTTEEEARKRLRALYKEDPQLFFMLESIPRISEKAVCYLVQDTDGTGPLREKRPLEAKAICAIDDDPKPVKLYTLTAEKVGGILPSALREKLRARQRVQFDLE